MAGKLIPMRELRALAKRAEMSVAAELGPWSMSHVTDDPGLRYGASVDINATERNHLRAGKYIEIYGAGRTQRAAQIQARANAKLFLECVLAMEYGEAQP